MQGEVDQSAGMLDDEAKEKGYALLCVSEPQSDCTVAVIEEVIPWIILAAWSAGPCLHLLTTARAHWLC